MIFVIFANIGSGLVQLVIPQFAESSLYRAGLESDSNVITEFGKVNESINPQGQGIMQDQNSAFDEIFNWVSISFIFKFFSMLDKFVFGLPVILKSIFGSFMSPAVSTMLFDVFGRLIILSIYIITVFRLFTGKDL